jgi:hypothetical protein
VQSIGFSTPNSRKILEPAIKGVPESELPLMLYKNAMKLYGLGES